MMNVVQIGIGFSQVSLLFDTELQACLPRSRRCLGPACWTTYEELQGFDGIIYTDSWQGPYAKKTGVRTAIASQPAFLQPQKGNGVSLSFRSQLVVKSMACFALHLDLCVFVEANDPLSVPKAFMLQEKSDSFSAVTTLSCCRTRNNSGTDVGIKDCCKVRSFSCTGNLAFRCADLTFSNANSFSSFYFVGSSSRIPLRWATLRPTSRVYAPSGPTQEEPCATQTGTTFFICPSSNLTIPAPTSAKKRLSFKSPSILGHETTSTSQWSACFSLPISSASSSYSYSYSVYWLGKALSIPYMYQFAP